MAPLPALRWMALAALGGALAAAEPGAPAGGPAAPSPRAAGGGPRSSGGGDGLGRPNRTLALLPGGPQSGGGEGAEELRGAGAQEGAGAVDAALRGTSSSARGAAGAFPLARRRPNFYPNGEPCLPPDGLDRCWVCIKTITGIEGIVAKLGCGFVGDAAIVTTCEAMGGGPEDPLADACAVLGVAICTTVASYMAQGIKDPREICQKMSYCPAPSAALAQLLEGGGMSSSSNSNSSSSNSSDSSNRSALGSSSGSSNRSSFVLSGTPGPSSLDWSGGSNSTTSSSRGARSEGGEGATAVSSRVGTELARPYPRGWCRGFNRLGFTPSRCTKVVYHSWYQWVCRPGFCIYVCDMGCNRCLY